MKKILLTILHVLAIILALCSILSLFRNAEIRFIKMLDFPRIQFFLLSLITLLLLITTNKERRWYSYVLIAGLSIGMLINSMFLINYTKLVAVEVPTAKDVKNPDDQFSLLLSNVKMSNRKAQPLIESIELKKPDLVLAMEVDEWWDEELKVLEEDYPFSHHTINDVTYGMVLYSKLPLKTVEVLYLTNEKVPSFKSTITLANGKNIIFHAVHPVPPTHFKRIPDNEGEEENALKILGKQLKGRKLPTLVAGDLNDLVWSFIDELTGTEDILHDVRVGRGFYNSYNAKYFFMRWPLDHVFVTEEFRLKKLECLPKIGSDHFPMYVELTL